MRVSQKCRTSLIVPNEIGLHAQPAAMLARRAQQYDADIVMACGRKKVNAKSILGILTLCVGKGVRVAVTADGHDAPAAILAIEELFACSFRDEVPAAEVELSLIHI